MLFSYNDGNVFDANINDELGMDSSVRFEENYVPGGSETAFSYSNGSESGKVYGLMVSGRPTLTSLKPPTDDPQSHC